MLLEFMKSKTGRILISIIWGLALAMLFRRTCAGNRCMMVSGPPVQQVSKTTYDFGTDGCYKFSPQLAKCAPDSVKSASA